MLFSIPEEHFLGLVRSRCHALLGIRPIYNEDRKNFETSEKLKVQRCRVKYNRRGWKTFPRPTAGFKEPPTTRCRQESRSEGRFEGERK